MTRDFVLDDNLDNIAKHPKNQQIFRGSRWQLYGSADRNDLPYSHHSYVCTSMLLFKFILIVFKNYSLASTSYALQPKICLFANFSLSLQQILIST